jgi:tRNA 2-thiocytidine biosynthesis protein TtcA
MSKTIPNSERRKKASIRLNRKVLQTILKHSQLEEGDNLMVAVSGGKDSLILLETLSQVKRHLPFKIGLYAVHVHLNNVGYHTRKEYLETFCANLQVPFTWVEDEVDLTRDPRKTPCFVCSWFRRKQIFSTADSLQCNKVAFGHHLDDAVQTQLMNMVFHGSISSMPYKLKMFGGRITIVRPLLDITEKELSEYARYSEFEIQEKDCPYSKTTRRDSMKQIVREMEKMSKYARKNIFRSSAHIFNEYLPLD